MLSQFSGKTILRGVLLLIIFGTLPFYLLEVFVLASNGGAQPDEDISTATTEAPLGADRTASRTPSPTPTRNLTATAGSTLAATPPIFIPPTRFPTSTPTIQIFIPTDTIAPSFTPVVNVDRDGDGVLDGDDHCPLA